jgi:hypothetical protein
MQLVRAKPPGVRRIMQTPWDTLFEVHSGLSDTVLLEPRTIAASRTSLFVYDAGDKSLKAFDRAGRIQWRFGRAGAGPGELMNVVDIEADAEGRVWLSDGALGRVTVVDQLGRELREFVVRTGHVRHIVPLPLGLVTTQVQPNAYLVQLDSLGAIVERLQVPVAGIDTVPPPARQMMTAHAADGRTWAVMFPFADPVVTYRDNRPHCVGTLIEGIPFQQLRPGSSPQVSAIGIAMSDSQIFTLPQRKTSQGSSIVDTYSSRSCEYIGSAELPRAVVSIAAHGDILFLGYEDPSPGVIALRSKRSP